MKKAKIILILSLCMLLTGLFGCRQEGSSMNDISFTVLMYHAAHDDVQPYYVIRKNQNGSYTLKVISFDTAVRLKDKGEYGLLEHTPLFRGVVSSKKMDDSDVLTISEALKEQNADQWAGFSEVKPLPEGVMDGGYSFEFALIRDDGTCIHAEGIRTEPEGFSAFADVLIPILLKYEK